MNEIYGVFGVDGYGGEEPLKQLQKEGKPVENLIFCIVVVLSNRCRCSDFY